MKELFVAAVLLLLPGALLAQPAPEPRADDVSSPEAIVAAAYESLARQPGENFDWDRFRSLHLPDALLIPNTEQTGGEFRILSVQGFIDWVDGFYAENVPIGSEKDLGFIEGQIHAVRDDYGDVVHIMSTYEKRIPGSEQSLGRGVNSFQLVFGDGRWWIASVAWDEENGAGPIPAKYLPE